MANTDLLAELEIEGTDVVGAWNALEPLVADFAGSFGAPAARSDYYVGSSDDQGNVTGPELSDCLTRVESPTSISVTYKTKSISDPDPHTIELRIMRYRRFKELNVHVRVTGPVDVQKLGLFERTKTSLAAAIARLNGP